MAQIAVLGGGLTGLSSALHLSRRLPTTRIVLLEKQDRLGGWVRSERVDIPKLQSSVLLEAGPRSLRPNGKAVLELINLLKLQDEVITVPKTAPPAKARFLYIPDSYGIPEISGLQRIPSSMSSLFSSPLTKIMVPAVLNEFVKQSNRLKGSSDESVDSFLSRRFGKTFARTFGSALVHGIYATDSRKLSVRAAFPSIWNAEERGKGSIGRGFMVPEFKQKPTWEEEGGYQLGNVPELMKDVSVYSFRNGMETLTKALEAALIATKNVTILKNTHVSGLKVVAGQKIEVSHSHNTPPFKVDRVVSALPLPMLHNLITDRLLSIPQLTKNPMSTVYVVNFIFPSPPKDIHPEGFGYLIPRPPDGYPTESKSSAKGILGTVFDSCSLHAQDLPNVEDYYNNASHTKLTLMTGGPYPMPPLPEHLVSSESETKMIPAFIADLLEQLKVHVGHDLPNPVYWRIWKNEACIPTLLPGHLDRMSEMQHFLMEEISTPRRNGDSDTSSEKGWAGRLAVIGAGVGGVSVGDCVEAGRQVAKRWS